MCTAKQYSFLVISKIDQYEILIGEQILPLHESRIVEQTNSTYSPLGKALEK